MMKRKFPKAIYFLICFLLIFEQSGFAQVAAQLDLSARFFRLTNVFTQDKFRPLHLRYLEYLPEDNNFKLLLDKGDSFATGDTLRSRVSPANGGTVPEEELKAKTQELLNYFFVGISLPNDSFWVNLRPDSPDNLIDPYLAQTDVGKILLEADLQLKKDTSLATSPQTAEGKEYWNKLYKKAGEFFGNENITIPTLTRPWIVPGEIIIRETQGLSPTTTTGDTLRSRVSPANGDTAPSAYIYKATLKVMLESDYLKSQALPVGDTLRSRVYPGMSAYEFTDERLKALNEYSTQLIKELIIPKLTKEVNSSKRYAPLRQVYYSLILAQWFKQSVGDTLRSRVSPARKGTVFDLIDSKNIANLTSQGPWSKTTYFNAYKQSFNQGEYNIKESAYAPTGQVIRSYMSGGISLGQQVSDAIASSTIISRRVQLSIKNFIMVLTESGTTAGPFKPKIELHRNDLKAGLTEESTIKERNRASKPVANGEASLPLTPENIHPIIYDTVLALNSLGFKTYGSGPDEIYGWLISDLENDGKLLEVREKQLKAAAQKIKAIHGESGKIILVKTTQYGRFDIFINPAVILKDAKSYWDDFTARLKEEVVSPIGSPVAASPVEAKYRVISGKEEITKILEQWFAQGQRFDFPKGDWDKVIKYQSGVAEGNFVVAESPNGKSILGMAYSHKAHAKLSDGVVHKVYVIDLLETAIKREGVGRNIIAQIIRQSINDPDIEKNWQGSVVVNPGDALNREIYSGLGFKDIIDATMLTLIETDPEGYYKLLWMELPRADARNLLRYPQLELDLSPAGSALEKQESASSAVEKNQSPLQDDIGRRDFLRYIGNIAKGVVAATLYDKLKPLESFGMSLTEERNLLLEEVTSIPSEMKKAVESWNNIREIKDNNKILMGLAKNKNIEAIFGVYKDKNGEIIVTRVLEGDHSTVSVPEELKGEKNIIAVLHIHPGKIELTEGKIKKTIVPYFSPPDAVFGSIGSSKDTYLPVLWQTSENEFFVTVGTGGKLTEYFSNLMGSALPELRKAFPDETDRKLALAEGAGFKIFKVGEDGAFLPATKAEVLRALKSRLATSNEIKDAISSGNIYKVVDSRFIPLTPEEIQKLSKASPAGSPLGQEPASSAIEVSFLGEEIAGDIAELRNAVGMIMPGEDGEFKEEAFLLFGAKDKERYNIKRIVKVLKYAEQSYYGFVNDEKYIAELIDRYATGDTKLLGELHTHPFDVTKILTKPGPSWQDGLGEDILLPERIDKIIDVPLGIVTEATLPRDGTLEDIERERQNIKFNVYFYVPPIQVIKVMDFSEWLNSSGTNSAIAGSALEKQESASSAMSLLFAIETEEEIGQLQVRGKQFFIRKGIREGSKGNIIIVSFYDERKDMVGYFEFWIKESRINFVFINKDYRGNGYLKEFLGRTLEQLKDGILTGERHSLISSYVRNPLVALALLDLKFSPDGRAEFKDLETRVILGATKDNGKIPLYVTDGKNKDAIKGIIESDKDWEIFELQDSRIEGGKEVKIFTAYSLDLTKAGSSAGSALEKQESASSAAEKKIVSSSMAPEKLTASSASKADVRVIKIKGLIDQASEYYSKEASKNLGIILENLNIPKGSLILNVGYGVNPLSVRDEKGNVIYRVINVDNNEFAGKAEGFKIWKKDFFDINQDALKELGLSEKPVVVLFYNMRVYMDMYSKGGAANPLLDLDSLLNVRKYFEKAIELVAPTGQVLFVNFMPPETMTNPEVIPNIVAGLKRSAAVIRTEDGLEVAAAFAVGSELEKQKPASSAAEKVQEYAEKYIAQFGAPDASFGGVKELNNPKARAEVIDNKVYINSVWIDKMTEDEKERVVGHEVQHTRTDYLRDKKGLQIGGLHNLKEFQGLQQRIGELYDKVVQEKGDVFAKPKARYQENWEALSLLRGYQIYSEQLTRGLQVTTQPYEFIEAFRLEDLVFLNEEYLFEAVKGFEPKTREGKTTITYEDLGLTVPGPEKDKISSSLIDKTGGIDFRALPAVTQPMPLASAGDTLLRRVFPAIYPQGQFLNLDKEWQQIENMVNAGMIPSTERIKEYLKSCCASSAIEQEIDKVLSCLAEILRIEEENVQNTEPGLKEMLSLLESDKSASEIQLALAKITVEAKEPRVIVP